MATKPGYAQAEPSWLPKESIHRVAESISDQIGYKPGDDLPALVKQIGGRVKVETTLLQDPEHTGSLYVNGMNDFEIIVPSHTSLLRDRFTIAHELGHYYLHYVWPHQSGKSTPAKVVALRKGSNRIEWEANWFAAGFLMPSGDFRSAVRKTGRNVAAIARQFDVSQRAVEVRIEDLNL